MTTRKGSRIVELTLAASSLLGAGAPIPLAGTSQPFDVATLERLFPRGKDEYLRKSAGSLDQAIAGGFLLGANRQEILDLARLSFPDSAAPGGGHGGD
jgi:hypothetical protein